MNDIPIQFEHKGKKFKGHFSKVTGAGGTSAWHLMDDQNLYLGRLRMIGDKWFFDDSRESNKLTEIADYFGDFITAWYE